MSHSVVQLTQDLVAIPSVSRWSNAEVSDYIEKWLRANGFDEIERLEYTDKNGEIKVNLVAKKVPGMDRLVLKSVKQINKGDQLFFNYGEDRKEVIKANIWMK